MNAKRMYLVYFVEYICLPRYKFLISNNMYVQCEFDKLHLESRYDEYVCNDYQMNKKRWLKKRLRFYLFKGRSL